MSQHARYNLVPLRTSVFCEVFAMACRSSRTKMLLQDLIAFPQGPSTKIWAELIVQDPLKLMLNTVTTVLQMITINKNDQNSLTYCEPGALKVPVRQLSTLHS